MSLLRAAPLVLSFVTADALHMQSMAAVLGTGNPLKTGTVAETGATLLICAIGACLTLATSLLLVFCMYDAAANWLHRSQFHACKRKVERVNEVFQSKNKNELCPCCVEYIVTQNPAAKVVFLCGHRFHMSCTNAWFHENNCAPGRCPVCTQASGEVKSAMCPPVASCEDPSRDEAQLFILGRLHRKYPEIIDEACMKRWPSCHTEIWLSELSCPRYNSIFRKGKQ